MTHPPVSWKPRQPSRPNIEKNALRDRGQTDRPKTRPTTRQTLWSGSGKVRGQLRGRPGHQGLHRHSMMLLLGAGQPTHGGETDLHVTGLPAVDES